MPGNMATDPFARQAASEQSRVPAFAFVFAVCLCVVFCVGFAATGFVRSRQSRDIELNGRINPNTADAISLMRLPGIGASRSRAIVAHRQDCSKSNGPAFQKPDDLQKVKGIGPRTVENISQWLEFEDKRLTDITDAKDGRVGN